MKVVNEFDIHEVTYEYGDDVQKEFHQEIMDGRGYTVVDNSVTIFNNRINISTFNPNRVTYRKACVRGDHFL